MSGTGSESGKEWDWSCQKEVGCIVGSESGGGGWAEGWRSGCVPGEGIASGEKNGMN